MEEVENSERVFHRWRKLEGIDPDSLEMHYKINLLQKRLISKTEECVEKEIIIQDLTKELADCKKGAAKRPEMEIEESILQLEVNKIRRKVSPKQKKEDSVLDENSQTEILNQTNFQDSARIARGPLSPTRPWAHSRSPRAIWRKAGDAAPPPASGGPRPSRKHTPPGPGAAPDCQHRPRPESVGRFGRSPRDP